MLCQRSSHLQNYKSARMSRRTAVEQTRHADGWRTHRVDGLKISNYTRIENAHKVAYAKKFIFIM